MSLMIPSNMEMDARVWMLQLWQLKFPGGATIDTVARWCVAEQESLVRESSAIRKNTDYQRVYMLSLDLLDQGLLYIADRGAPPKLKPIAHWYEVCCPPAHFGETIPSTEETPTP